MDLFGAGLLAGFDATAVSVAVLSRGPGRRRARGFSRAPLEPGALLPSPSGPNVVRRDEVRDALARALGDVAPGGGPATLVLPDGTARLAVVEPPPGAEARDYVRFRLASSLPWSPSDAIVDLLDLGRGRFIGAAVQRATVAQYEQIGASAGLLVERVHLAPLVALAGLLGRGGRGRGRGARARQGSVHVILGDVALCLAVIRDGELVALRSRRRDPSAGEGARLLAEAARMTRLAGDGDEPIRLVLSGAGSSGFREDLGSSVVAGLEGPGEWPGATEVAWLGGALA